MVESVLLGGSAILDRPCCYPTGKQKVGLIGRKGAGNRADEGHRWPPSRRWRNRSRAAQSLANAQKRREARRRRRTVLAADIERAELMD